MRHYSWDLNCPFWWYKNLRACWAGGIGGAWHVERVLTLRLADGKLVVAVQLPCREICWTRIGIRNQLECLCGTFGGWRPEAAPQLPCSRGCSTPSNINRIPTGAERVDGKSL